MSFIDIAIEDTARQLRKAAKAGLYVGVSLSLVGGILTGWGLIRLAVETRQSSLVFLGIIMFFLILGCGSFYSWRSMLRHMAIASNARSISDRSGVTSYPRRSKKRKDAEYGSAQFIPGYGYAQGQNYGGYYQASGYGAYGGYAGGGYDQGYSTAYQQPGYAQQGYAQSGGYDPQKTYAQRDNPPPYQQGY